MKLFDAMPPMQRMMLSAMFSPTRRSRATYTYPRPCYVSGKTRKAARGNSGRAARKATMRAYANARHVEQRETEHLYRLGYDVKPSWLHSNSQPWAT